MATATFKPARTTNRAQIEAAAQGNKDQLSTLLSLHQRLQQIEEHLKATSK